MSTKKRKWLDEYVQYGFTCIKERDGIQHPQCMICNAKLSKSSLTPGKLKEHFLKLDGDGKYKHTLLAEFKLTCSRLYTHIQTDLHSIVRSCVPDRKAWQTTHHW